MVFFGVDNSNIRHKSASSFLLILTDLATSVKVSSTGLADIIEATLLAKGTVTADILSQTDEQGMVFIE